MLTAQPIELKFPSDKKENLLVTFPKGNVDFRT